jgi:large subunit ribosomal protein L10
MKNIEQIQSTTEQFDSSTFVLFIQYSDCNTSQWRLVKKELSKIGLQLRVIKTNQIKKKLKESSYELISQAFSGPMAVVFSEGKLPFRTLIQAVKLLNKEEKLNLIGGLYNKTNLFPSKVNELANLPSIEELLGKGITDLQFIGGLNLTQLVNCALTSQANIVEQSPQELMNLLEYKGLNF